jgi:hypothetical protein
VRRALYRFSRLGGAPIGKPGLSSEADLMLQEVLKKDVAQLRDFLGDPLKEWRPYA